MKVEGVPPLPESGMHLYSVLQQLEEVWIAQALERTKGNRSQAARLLGLQPSTLVTKMRKLGYKLGPPCVLGSPRPRRK